ncbi:MAG: membrane protein insertase YidC [Candidatus Aureabacteria bacterium]|nr:membrane protein insertase YidC [Candidatus Auribacterota bacterium]
MDRKTMLALLLSMTVILSYSYFFAPPQKKIASPDVGKEEMTVPSTRDSEKNSMKKESVTKIPEVAVVPPEGKLSTASNSAMDITFSERGGCIASATLRKSEIIKKSSIDIAKPLYPPAQPLAIKHSGQPEIDPYGLYEQIQGQAGAGEVSYRKNFGDIQITKSYSISPQGFTLAGRFELKNIGSADLPINDSLRISAGAVAALTQSEKDSFLGLDYMDDQGRIKRVAASRLRAEKEERVGIKWLALRNQFFAIVLRPDTPAAGYSAGKVRMKNGPDALEASLLIPSMILKAGETRTLNIRIYMGPKEYSALEAFGAAGVIDFGWFGFLGKWILKGLNVLYSICGNYGVAIILLTIIIRIILYPLNQKSFRSMKEMQKLQPKIAALQEKHKDDPKRKQEEMMKIYKEHGVNPAGGCLPLLIQMPILIAFFRVLQNAVELWGAPFCLWMKDLSEPDALWMIGTGEYTLPFVGRIINGKPYLLLNVLPILMLVVFYIQQKMTPTGGMASSPEQQQSQKMMAYLTPVMFGVIFYNMPAGLNLYFAVSTLLGILQQKYMIR